MSIYKVPGEAERPQVGGAWPSPVVAAQQLKIERGNHNCTSFLLKLLITKENFDMKYQQMGIIERH